jgi:hypothetical protein
LKLHYTGPKPIISQHGIFFKNGKEDKYIYIKLASRVLLAIDKNYSKQDKYVTYIEEHDALSNEKVLDILKTYEPDLETHIYNEEKHYEEHIDIMIEEVNNKLLTEEEKSTWINNINIMRPYMIQREINKLYYIHCIKAIKEIIHKDGIMEIDIDFNLQHWHILESIAGNLEYGVKSIPTVIKVEPSKEGVLMARLYINKNYE